MPNKNTSPWVRANRPQTELEASLAQRPTDAVARVLWLMHMVHWWKRHYQIPSSGSYPSPSREAAEVLYAGHVPEQEIEAAAIALALVHPNAAIALRDIYTNWHKQAINMAEAIDDNTSATEWLAYWNHAGTLESQLHTLWMEMQTKLAQPVTPPAPPHMVRSEHAARVAQVSANTIRLRAKREGWQTGRSGRVLTYPLDELQKAYPNRDFSKPPRRSRRKK